MISNQQNNDWFYRSGEQVSVEDLGKIVKGKRAGYGSIDTVEPCGRCGGRGGGPQWAHTGWTCYQCNGRQTFPTTVKVYSRKVLTKLEAAAAKRAAAKEAKRLAGLSERKAKADAVRSEFLKAHPDVPAKIQRLEWEQLRESLTVNLERWGSLSDAQVDLIDRQLAKQADEAARREIGHFGEIKKRYERVLTYERHTGWPRRNGYREDYWYVITFRDEDGHTFVYKGTTPPRHTKEPTNYRFTIIGHEEYNGVNQTRIGRIAEIASAVAVVDATVTSA